MAIEISKEENENENLPENKVGLTDLMNTENITAAMPELAAMFAPKIAFVLPIADRKVKSFFKEHNCIIVTKLQVDKEGNEDVVTVLLDKTNTSVRHKDPSKSLKDAICLNKEGEKMVYSTQQIKDYLLSDEFEEMLRTMDISTMMGGMF